MSDSAEHLQAIQRTAEMVRDPALAREAGAYGLRVLNVMWEDTARYLGSSVGPNISDLTLQIQHRRPGSNQLTLSLLPVIRYANFSDRTCDVPLERLFALAGNARGAALELVSLRDVLGDLRAYLAGPDSWAGEGRSLLSADETHAIVSAQACFLPVERGGVARFNPVLFNYQSRPKAPAVLTLLATPEGLSVTVIDNQRDAFEVKGGVWGQRLFFNAAGQRASLTGQRLSDVAAAGPVAGAQAGSAPAAGAVNVVLLVQVPLKQPPRPPPAPATMDWMEMEMERGISLPPDLEDAVIGHGELEGPFTELDGLPVERDPRYPVRVTIQLYKATATGAVGRGDLAQLASILEQIYSSADYAGSLVVDGGRATATGYRPLPEPPGWWDRFWDDFEARGGSRAVAVARLQASLGAPFAGSEWDLRRELKRLGFKKL